MGRVLQRTRGGIRPALWLTVDAGLAALIAWPAEALLLFLLNPDLPFTAGGFLATMLALAPQVLVLFVLAGPAIVLFATSLAVGRSTRRGLSVRYILRFALLDALLLALAAVHQWRSVGELLPDPARTALGLTATALAAGALLALGLTIADLRRPNRVGAPWVVVLALFVLVPLGIAADLRRVRVIAPLPVDAPGFVPARGLLLVEIPGLDAHDLDQYIESGATPALEALVSRGVIVPVNGGPVVDPVAMHATLLTGREPLHHGVLAAVRYRPATWERSFGIFPRGLLLRPLLRTPLWRRAPVGGASVGVVALPGIAAGLRLPLDLIGDPLGWPPSGGDAVVVLAPELRTGAAGRPAGRPPFACPSPPLDPGQLFDPPAADLPSTARLATEVRAALAEDLCAIAVARRRLAERTDEAAFVVVRLAGYARVAWQFAGWRAETPARDATDEEIAAYGRVMTRYVRALDPDLGRLFEDARSRLVALVSPLGVQARQDVGRVRAALLGANEATGTFAGPPAGVAVIAGEGVRAGERLPIAEPLIAILPTLLWAQGLPAAEDMGPIVRSAFTAEFVVQAPVYMLPSFARPVR